MSTPAIETPVPSNDPAAAPATPPVGQGETFFTQADIEAAVEKARQQEKDKLYGKVDGLQSRLDEIAAREAERVQAEETARREAEEKARLAEEENLSVKDLLARREQEMQERIAQTEQSFEARLAEMQQQREQEQALLAKEQAFNSLQSYKAQRLEAEKDTIAPQFHVFVNGNTQEEIEQSIAIAREKSAEVAAEVQAAMQAAQVQRRGTSVSGYAPVGPVEFESGQRTLSAQDIAGMDMAEYAKHRASLIGQGGANNVGLFGR
jgi:hypothetical protein